MGTIPRWGLVTAAAHEHLLHVRNGRVIHAAQGGSAWKWPFDTIALVDTSVRRLQFTADQITLEKTGVNVTGFAVYRVVAPRVAWRMIDLSDMERLEGILREMFVGATRRLVANLSLEDCLTRRKDALAVELMSEVAPVIQGRHDASAPGSEDDAEDRGWGFRLDTIEIQDVRVLSREVFERLQSGYRAKLALEAVEARASVERAEAALVEESARRVEAHRQAMYSLEQARVEAERERAREQVAHQSGLAELEQAAALARRTAEGEIERSEAEAGATLGVRLAEREAEATQLRATADAERIRLTRAAESEISEGRLRELLLTHTVPETARALAGTFGEISVRPADLTWLGEALRPVVAVLAGSRLPS